MELKFSKKIETESAQKEEKVRIKSLDKLNLKEKFLGVLRPSSQIRTSKSYIFLFLLFFGIFGVLIWQLSNLTLVQGEDMLSRSENNQIKVESITADRGVIFDKNGVKLVENVSSSKLYVSISKYIDEKGDLKEEDLNSLSDTLTGILGDHWVKTSQDKTETYTSIADRLTKIHEGSQYFTDILIATDLTNDEVIKIKANMNDLDGVYIDEGSKRSYPYKDILSSILGYTGDATAEDLDSLDYVNPNDIVGRTGLESEYNQKLSGKDGEMAWEVDILGKKISDEGLELQAPVSGENLYLTVDLDIQSTLYKALESGISTAKATGGAAVIEDVNTGAVVAMVTYPSYDNNLFIGGISVADYSALLNNTQTPLLNRAIGAQIPPGSAFKPLVAVGALDSKAITAKTLYTSTSNYTFTNGASFQEYHNHAYGTLNVEDALMVSSNIFFCETIRHWDINILDIYLQKFGIGQTTGIDLPGEMPGRLPSPANKRTLAETTSPWLDPVWYPEGDSCNSVIGQGITLVTPIQMANWVAAIANGGTLYQPHLADYFVDENGNKEQVNPTIIQSNIASEEAFDIVRSGMRAAVNGDRASITQLANVGVSVAAKTGTAEFGAIDKEGNYEHTHAWVSGFFPYDNPKYSFSVFLEDGGDSFNASNVMKAVISWMVANGKI
jgi:penicillin-binding protein 2